MAAVLRFGVAVSEDGDLELAAQTPTWPRHLPHSAYQGWCQKPEFAHRDKMQVARKKTRPACNRVQE